MLEGIKCSMKELGTQRRSLVLSRGAQCSKELGTGWTNSVLYSMEELNAQQKSLVLSRGVRCSSKEISA